MTGTPNSIITPQAPKSGTAVCTTANTTYTDSPTNTQTLYTAGAAGARLTRVTALTRATTSVNTELQLFRSADAGVTKRFFKSKLMSAYTVSANTAQPEADFGYSDLNPLVLAPGEVIYAAIGVTQTGVVFSVEGADY